MSTVFADNKVMSRQIFWKSNDGMVMRVANSRSGIEISLSSRSNKFNLYLTNRFFSPFSKVIVK
jgi:hypothetical protein